VTNELKEFRKARKRWQKTGEAPSEPPCVDSSHRDYAKYKFLPQWYDELKKEIAQVINISGFGVDVVRGLATDIYAKKTKEPVEVEGAEVCVYPCS